MKGTQRRQEILHLLSSSCVPYSGTQLAQRFSVSRQVIVQDMTLMRAEGHDILSTNKGYLLNNPLSVKRTLKFYHTDNEIADELYTIVDFGGTIDDVSVHHRVYGKIEAKLNIRSRIDVLHFLDELKSGKSTPLKDITSGYHYHTISASSEATLDLIEKELDKKGLLCKKKEPQISP